MAMDDRANSTSTRRSTARCRCSGAKATRARRWRISRKPWTSPAQSLCRVRQQGRVISQGVGSICRRSRRLLPGSARQADIASRCRTPSLRKPPRRHQPRSSARMPRGAWSTELRRCRQPIDQELISRLVTGEEDVRQRFERAIAEGDCLKDPTPPISLRYIATILQGMAVQAAGGTTREQLRKIAEITLRTWPPPSLASV